MKAAQRVMYPLSRLALSQIIQNEEPLEEIGHARGSQLSKRMRAVIVVRFLLRIHGWDVPWVPTQERNSSEMNVSDFIMKLYES